MQVRYEKMAIIDQYFASAHVVNAATVRCCKQSVAAPWQVCDTYRLILCTALVLDASYYGHYARFYAIDRDMVTIKYEWGLALFKGVTFISNDLE